MDLDGDTISNSTTADYGFRDQGTLDPSITMLEGAAWLKVDDFATTGISLVVHGDTAASPVSVIITY